MLVYLSGVDVSSSTLRFLMQQLRRHRRTIGSRWRRLTAGRQALLTLAPALPWAMRGPGSLCNTSRRIAVLVGWGEALEHPRSCKPSWHKRESNPHPPQITTLTGTNDQGPFACPGIRVGVRGWLALWAT